MERMMKRPREVEDEEDEPMIFKHMKRTRMRGIVDISEDEEDLKEEKQKNMPHKEYMIEGPSDPNVEVWEEIWDEDLVRKFREHNWAQEEVKIIGTTGAGAGAEREEFEDEFIFPSNPDGVKLVPRIDIDSVVGDSDEVLDWESQGNEFDVYTPLTWEEMWDFDEKRSKEMREVEKGYENWLKHWQKGEEFEEVDLVSKSDDSE